MNGRSTACLLTSVALVLLFQTPLRAETLLRWKLQPGQTLRYDVRQAGRTETAGAGKPTSLVIELSMQLDWTVDSIDAEGTAAMTQKISRLTINLTSDQVAPIAYDSAARAPATGPSKTLADAVAGLIGAACKVRMSNRGEILAVEASEELRKAWEKAGQANLVTEEGLSRILRQALIVLPEKPIEPGEKWDAVDELPFGQGNLRIAKHYAYDGSEERAGAPREKITVKAEITQAQPANAPAPATALKDATQSGVLWFDAEAGRFVESQLELRLVSERPYGDATIRVTSTTQLGMKLAQ